MVVNEAAACGLPLVVSDRVGAAFDLVVDGRNGALVPADDPRAAGEAIRALAADPERRRAAGEASREIMRDWGYEPSIENLVRVARRVAGRQARQRLAVDRDLLVDDRVPRRPLRGAERAFGESGTQRLVVDDPVDRSDRRVGIVGDDERLAVAERGRDSRAVGHDHGRSHRGRLGRHEPEVLPARGEHEHVGPAIEVEGRARGGRQHVDAARRAGIGGRGGDRGHRPVPVVRPREDDVDLRHPPRGLEEVLHALLGGDAADVEDDRRTLRHDPVERVPDRPPGAARETRCRGVARARARRRTRERRRARAARRR